MSHQQIDAVSLRQKLVDDLKAREIIQSRTVEAAFRAVPRHKFVPDVPLEQAYADWSVPLKQDEGGRTLSSLSQPAMIAIMLEQLGLEPGHKVLEIGAGSGYNAALMAHMVGEPGQVVTVEIDADLADTARKNLAEAGLQRVPVVCADGGYGYPDAAPYDRIILTVSAPDVVPAWVEQLKASGRLLLPLAINRLQMSIAFEKVTDHLASRSVQGCGFVPLQGAFAEVTLVPVPLGPDPGLTAFFEPKHAPDAETVYAWLTGPSKTQDTGLLVTAKDVFSGLGLWLDLYVPGVCGLMAKGDIAERNIVPPLVQRSGEQKVTSTMALPGKDGLAALARAPGQPVPLVDVGDPGAMKATFPLFVRQYGPGKSVAQRLLGQIKAWDAAGRPSSKDLRIRVYQRDGDYTPVEDELVIEKNQTRLVLNWSTH